MMSVTLGNGNSVQQIIFNGAAGGRGAPGGFGSPRGSPQVVVHLEVLVVPKVVVKLEVPK